MVDLTKVLGKLKGIIHPPPSAGNQMIPQEYGQGTEGPGQQVLTPAPDIGGTVNPEVQRTEEDHWAASLWKVYGADVDQYMSAGPVDREGILKSKTGVDRAMFLETLRISQEDLARPGPNRGFDQWLKQYHQSRMKT